MFLSALSMDLVPFLTTYSRLLKDVKEMYNYSGEKWKSIVHHISSVHKWDNKPKVLFPKCVHQILPPKE